MTEQNSHPGFWNKYVQAPLDLVMRNSAITPSILFVLAVAPFVITAVVLVLVFLGQ
jgi:hypothetical protein